MSEAVDVELLANVLDATLHHRAFVLIFRHPDGRDGMVTNQVRQESLVSVLRQAADHIEEGGVELQAKYGRPS